MHKEPTRHKYITRLDAGHLGSRYQATCDACGADDVTSETSERPDDVIERFMHARMPRRDDVTLKNRQHEKSRVGAPAPRPACHVFYVIRDVTG